MNKDPDSWRRVSVEAVMSGSRAQGENVLRMAIEDILQLEERIANAKAMLSEALFSEHLTGYAESRIRAALIILTGPRE